MQKVKQVHSKIDDVDERHNLSLEAIVLNQREKNIRQDEILQKQNEKNVEQDEVLQKQHEKNVEQDDIHPNGLTASVSHEISTPTQRKSAKLNLPS